MSRPPSKWTVDRLHAARAILSQHTILLDALAEIAETLGFPVTRASLDRAFALANMPTPFTYLAPDLEPLDRETIRMPVAEVHELPDDSSTTNDAAEPASSTDTATDAAIQALVDATKRGAIDLETACNLLERSPKAVRDLIAEARDLGYTIDLEGTQIGRRPAAVREDITPIAIQTANEWRTFAIASDIHIGSKFFMRPEFVHFVHLAYERGVRTILGPGDILDGVYKHSQWEEYAHGFDEQAEDAAAVFPKLPGLQYVMISGNHDQTHEVSSGLDVCKALVDVFRRHGREDLIMLGSRGATLDLIADGDTRGLRVELWHPLGGGAYALSYKLQRKIESYAVGAKPDVLLAGHWHQQCYFTQRGIHAMSCGTFHGGSSPFGRALGTTPAIGGWVVEYAQTPDGTVRHYRPEWIAFFENECVREVRV